MGKVDLPEKILGQWIYLKRLRQRNDVTLLMRHTFNFSAESGSDTLLFISACSSYQVFINGRFVGTGPRGHQNSGTSYIDLHEIRYYMEPGNNLIAIKMTYNIDPESGDNKRIPGMWCQIQNDSKTILYSDATWDILEVAAFSGSMAKVAPGKRCAGFTDMRTIPAHWNDLSYECDSSWEHPDWLTPPGSSSTLMELHPVPPAPIAADTIDFSLVSSGHIADYPVFSLIRFSDCSEGETNAAVSYIFCDEEKKLEFQLFADHPFKFFCNRKRIFDGDQANGEHVELELTTGWNRLVVFARKQCSGMGIMLLGHKSYSDLMPLSDMLDSAVRGWCATTLKRIRFEECTPAVRIEDNGDLQLLPNDDEHLQDNWDYLKNSIIEKSSSPGGILQAGDLHLYKLDQLHYGFAKFTVNASAGDIIDIIVGTGEGRDLFPRSANGKDRESAVFICHEGENELLMPWPADCRCAMLHLRKCSDGVNILESSFDELNRNFNRECSFNCSDRFFNQLWECGRASLARSSSMLVPADGASGHASFMLDSFIDAINVAAVFGDSEYITAKLRQYAASQLEDGSIPALNFGRNYTPALMHLFFFSSWLLFNYRFSCNMVELRNMLPILDLVRRYMESLLDENQESIDMETVKLIQPPSGDTFSACRTPIILNALLCRFMLSASDIYELTERKTEAKLCRRMVRHISAAIEKEYFDSETGLFADDPITPEGDIAISLMGNFFPFFAGIKTEECFETFVNTFFEFDTGDAKTFEAESPYFHYLFLEMLFALDQREWGIMYLRRYWQKRIENVTNTLKDGVSGEINSTGFSEGHCIVPNVFLIREIVGVRIAEPAHALIYFNPAYDTVDQAEAAIPTANGRIHIKWERSGDGLEVNIYSSNPLKVMPEFPEEMIRNSTFRLSENVVLVKVAEKKPHEE